MLGRCNKLSPSIVSKNCDYITNGTSICLGFSFLNWWFSVISWSHVMDLTRSGQFQISTDPASRGWLSHQLPDYLTFRIISDFWINLLNQLFESTFWINSRNQPSHWIGGATSLWYVTSSKTYVRRIVLLPTDVRMIQVVDLLAGHPLVEACSVPPSSTPWWRYRWKPYWTQLGLLPYADVSFVFRKVRVPDENDESRFGSRPSGPQAWRST